MIDFFANIGATPAPAASDQTQDRFTTIGAAPTVPTAPQNPKKNLFSSIKTGNLIRNKSIFQPIAKGYEKLSDKITDIATASDQGVARSIGTVGVTAGNAFASIGNTLAGKKVLETFPAETPTDTSKAGKAIFGGQPIRTLPSAAQNAQEKSDVITSKLGVSPVNRLGGYGLAVGGILMDLSGFGGEKSVATTATDQIPEAFFKHVARESDPVILESTLRNVGLDETNAKKLASQLAPTKTVNEAKDVLANFGTAPETPSAPRALPKSGQTVDSTLSPQEIMAKAQADAAHLGTTKPLVDRNTQDLFASIGKNPTEDVVYQGVGQGKQSRYWTTKLEDAQGYANQKGLKGTGEVRALKWKDVPDDAKTIFPDQENAEIVRRDFGDSYIGRPLSKAEYEKVSQHIYVHGDVPSTPVVKQLSTSPETVVTPPRDTSNWADSAGKRLTEKYPDVKISVNESPKAIDLHQIVVPEDMRNQGTGTKMMRDLVSYADEKGKSITLTPSGEFGGDPARLVDFYKRFGFDQKGQDMVRPALSKAEQVQSALARAKAGENFGLQTPREARSPKAAAPELPATKVAVRNSEVELPPELAKDQERIATKKAYLRDELKNHPGRKLQSLINAKEGEIMEPADITKYKSTDPARYERLKAIQAKRMRIAESAFEGTKLADKFDDVDTQRESLADYRAKRQELRQANIDQASLSEKIRNHVANSKDEVALRKIAAKSGALTDIKIANEEKKADRAREKLRYISAVEKMLKEKGRDRAGQIKAITDFFHLTDTDRKGLIRLNADFRTMTEPAFQNLLKAIQGKAYDIEQKRNALMEVQTTIENKELHKVDNFREAMKMRKFENMSVSELNRFNDLLAPFLNGDTFLGKRTIQTAKLTSLGNVKTVREAKEHLAKEAGVPVTSINNVTPTWFDQFKSDIFLKNKNPLYKVMVENTMGATVRAAQREHEVDETFQKLMSAARQSRKRGLLDRLIPTDKLVYRYNEVSPIEQEIMAKQMTPEELKVAQYIDKYFTTARDYLLEIEALQKYVKNYIPRTHMGALEYLKTHGKEIFSKKGAKAFLKEMLDAEKLQTQSFKIMEDNTGEVLPKQKFFKYSIEREGHLNPSTNVGKVFMDYVRTFERMRQLNDFVPKLDLYANLLTNDAVKTRFGLVKDDTLSTFVKKWLNNKRGRPVSFLGQGKGSPPEIALRFAVAFTRLRDLGLNIPVGLASNIGAQVSTYVGIGEKAYATGIYRLNTKMGKKILLNNIPMVGKTIKENLFDVSKTLGEKTTGLIYSLFSSADRSAKAVWLLGKLTAEEFKTGKITPERLTEIKLDMGRYHASEGTTSIQGSTALGSAGRQYKGWALPIIGTISHNVKELARMAKSGENFKNTKEFKELLRITIASSLVVLGGYEAYSKLNAKKDKTFLERLATSAYSESLSIIGALNPVTLTSFRGLSLVQDLAKNLVTLGVSLVTGSRDKNGNLLGLSALGKDFLPVAATQFIPAKADSDLHDMISEENDATKQADLDAETKWAELKKIATISQDQAKAAFDDLSKTDPDMAKKVSAIAKEEKRGLTTTDRLTLQLDTKNGDRARYIFSELQKLDNQEDKKQFYGDLLTKKVITAEVATQLKSMIAADKPSFQVGTTTTKGGIIHTVFAYAKALKVDPENAFKGLFTREQLNYVDGNVAVLDRLPYTGKWSSESIATQRAKTQGVARNAMRLDHTIPLEMGGDNSEKNLSLVTQAQWESYTPIENLLGGALRAGTIKRKEAQDLILRFKKGQLTADQVRASVSPSAN